MSFRKSVTIFNFNVMFVNIEFLMALKSDDRVMAACVADWVCV